MEKSNVVILRSNPVQPDPRVEKEANSLIKDGHGVIVVAWDRNSNYRIKESFLELENGRVKIIRFGILSSYGAGMRSNLIPLLKFQARLMFWLKRNHKLFDVIHACDFDTGYIAKKCAFLLRKKIVYDIYDYYVDTFNVPRVFKKIIEKLDHKIINSADGVIICTEKRKQQIKGTNPKRLAVIHNSPPSVNIPKLSTKADDSSRIRISYVGILNEGRLLKELAQVIADNNNLELHIGGFGKFEEYFRDMASHHENIYFYGRIPYSETLELENECDIMVALYDPRMPNHNYAGPNKFYEALMLGKPLIMVENTGMDEIIKNYNIGEVIKFNSESLLKAIEMLVVRKREWTMISNKMKRLYYKEFSWIEMEKRLLCMYDEITNS